MIFEEFEGELRWAEIEPELEHFQRYLVAEARRLKIERDADVLDWERQRGVYLLFGNDEKLLYVGYSLDGFGRRFAIHRVRFEWKWADLVVFPPDLTFFAPALESYLIQRFQPPLNATGSYV